MEIIHKTQLTPAESERLFHWREHVFDPMPGEIEWSSLAHHYVAMDNGRAAGHAACGLKCIEQRGVRVPILGIGAIVVHPDHQGKKLGQTILQHIHGLMGPEYGVHIAWLFCGPHMAGYYAACGYETITAPVSYEQSWGLMPCPWVSMACAREGKKIDDEAIAILSKPW